MGWVRSRLDEGSVAENSTRGKTKNDITGKEQPPPSRPSEIYKPPSFPPKEIHHHSSSHLLIYTFTQPPQPLQPTQQNAVHHLHPHRSPEPHLRRRSNQALPVHGHSRRAPERDLRWPCHTTVLPDGCPWCCQLELRERYVINSPIQDRE